MWAAALLLTQLMYFVNTWVGTKVDRALLVDIRQRVHDHLQTLSLDFFTRSRSGELIQRVTVEPAGVQRLLTDCLLPPLIDTVVLIVAIGYLLAISWQMTVAALVLTPLALITLRFAGRGVQAAMRRVMNADRAMAAELEQTVNGIAEIQTFNAEPLRSKRFREVSEHSASSTANSVVWMQAMANGSQVFVALSTVVVLLVGIAFSASFGLTFAGLIVFTGMVPTMFGAAQRVMGAYTAYHSVAPNAASTYELLDTRPSVRTRGRRRARRGPRQPGVRGCDVRLRARPDRSRRVVVLHRRGRDGGAGRRHRVGQVDGVQPPAAVPGSAAGADSARRPRHRGVTIASLRDQVSKLAQFPFFTKDTIRENIRLARPDAGDADVEEACKQANVHAVIVDPTKMHDGYDTVVDVQVPSGGQKRLIALARCLLRKPEVLLLDEPTENLDADQRARLTGVIRDYARDRTCVVISHDMDFIAAVADRILVLEDGRIAQDGDHRTLMAEGGLYKRLYEAQNVAHSHQSPRGGPTLCPCPQMRVALRQVAQRSAPSRRRSGRRRARRAQAAPPAWRSAPNTSPRRAAGPRCSPEPLRR